MKNKQIILETKNIVKTYGEGEGLIYALNNVSLKIYDGEFLVIIGGSGSGKSTLLNMLGGMDNVDSGEILYKGKDITNFSARQLTTYRKDDIGFVFQFFNLITDLTVYQNVTLAPGSGKNPEKVDELLRGVGLLEKKNNYPAQLSGGQQQRVSIARAMNKDSNILLCDEPTGALDDASGREVLRLLQTIHREQKKTIVLVTHAQEITKLAERVVRMKDARIVEDYTNEYVSDVDEVSW